MLILREIVTQPASPCWSSPWSFHVFYGLSYAAPRVGLRAFLSRVGLRAFSLPSLSDEAAGRENINLFLFPAIFWQTVHSTVLYKSTVFVA